MSARALVPALPSGARAPGAFSAPSSPGFTASSLHSNDTPAAASSLALCYAAEASPPWGRPNALLEAPPATLQEARDLRDGLTALVARERAAAAEFLIALAEFDRRRGWEALGHGSLFSFLTRDLRLSPATAYTRLSAARLIPGFPEVEAALRDGRLCVTSTGEVAKVLTRENQVEVLPRFFGLSSREAKEVVASLRPRELPRHAELVTRLAVVSAGLPEATAADRPPGTSVAGPSGATWAGSGRPAEVSPQVNSPATNLASLVPRSTGVVRAQGEGASRGLLVPATEAEPEAEVPSSSPDEDGVSDLRPTLAPELRPSSVEPLSADHRRLHLTVRTTFLEKLRAARRGLDHSRPGASLEEVLETALDLLLEKQARRRGEVKRPRAVARAVPGEALPSGGSTPTPVSGAPVSGVPGAAVAAPEAPAMPPGQEPGARLLAHELEARPVGSQSPSRRRAIPAAIRREVWSRDGHRCQFPVDGGGVCGSGRRLELDHLVPVALGGPDTADNLRVVCRAHNLVAARAEFGEARMADQPKRPRSPPPDDRHIPYPAWVVRAPEVPGPDALRPDGAGLGGAGLEGDGTDGAATEGGGTDGS